MYTVHFVNPQIQFNKFNSELLVLNGPEIVYRRPVKFGRNITDTQIRNRVLQLIQQWLDDHNETIDYVPTITIDRPQ